MPRYKDDSKDCAWREKAVLSLLMNQSEKNRKYQIWSPTPKNFCLKRANVFHESKFFPDISQLEKTQVPTQVSVKMTLLQKTKILKHAMIRNHSKRVNWLRKLTLEDLKRQKSLLWILVQESKIMMMTLIECLTLSR
jgi:hypothetical protein